ncbi:MAG: hypothetical protein IPI67_10430 [Myxococcales bacterium]|nr:hypothetical protein [Myxococcales bacterium]
MRLAELLELHARHSSASSLAESLGDGLLLARNPFLRRIRQESLARGARFSLADPGNYFAFPLIALDTVLRTRTIPYRDNVAALRELEAGRPGFFTTADLRKNRPMPNFVLHESAHVVAFDVLFGRPKCVRESLAVRECLPQVMLCEAFAMTAEYLALCAVSDTDRAERWLFSLSSYRHRAQKKRAVGELFDELGQPSVVAAMLVGFLYQNYLVDRVDRTTLARALDAAGFGTISRVRPALEQKLRGAVNTLAQMSRDFRLDTARLYLTTLGYPRDIQRVLAHDPFVRAGGALGAGIAELTRLLTVGQ